MNTTIAIPMARLSFAKIFQPKGFGQSNENPKYSLNAVMDVKEHGDTLKKIQATINDLLKENKIKVPKEKLCLKDGSDMDYDGYGEGTWYVAASNSKKPTIVRIENGKNVAVTEEEAGEMGILYSGCYVDVSIRLWAQNNQYGKRINASLEAVRFRKHGEAFGAAPADADSAFGDIEVSDDGDDLDDDMFS